MRETRRVTHHLPPVPRARSFLFLLFSEGEGDGWVVADRCVSVSCGWGGQCGFGSSLTSTPSLLLVGWPWGSDFGRARRCREPWV